MLRSSSAAIHQSSRMSGSEFPPDRRFGLKRWRHCHFTKLKNYKRCRGVHSERIFPVIDQRMVKDPRVKMHAVGLRGVPTRCNPTTIKPVSGIVAHRQCDVLSSYFYLFIYLSIYSTSLHEVKQKTGSKI
jgi:hypothetical protein